MVESNNEEIRWELDKILEFLNWLINLHENEQKTFWDNYEKIHSSFITGRNSIIAGIAFGIGIIISLVSIEELGGEYVDFVVYGLIAVAIVFIGTNILLYFAGKNYQLLNEAYENDVIELLELKGWLLGTSIRDKPNKDQIMFLAKFTFSVSQVIAYNINLKAQNLLNQDPLELKVIKEVYEILKENLEHYKKLDLKIVKTIEIFVKEFEKKEKINQ